MSYKCPNCGNETDFDIKHKPIVWLWSIPKVDFIICDKCGHNGSESEFVKESE